MIRIILPYRVVRSAFTFIAALCLVTTMFSITANQYAPPQAVTADTGAIGGDKFIRKETELQPELPRETELQPELPRETEEKAESESREYFTAESVSEVSGEKKETAELEGVGDSAVLWNAAVNMEDFIYLTDIPLSEELQRFTYERCIVNKLDYSFVLALMWRESRFKTDAVGVNSNGTADSGIMQINDINRNWLYDELGITDLLDPKQNITAGTTMLGRFVEKYGAHDALLAYQYGEAGMKKKLEQGVTTNGQIQLLYEKRRDFADMLESFPI